MSFSSGFLHDRITVQNRKAAEMGVYGVDSTGAEWEDVACLHANVGWQKGTSAMREGALDVYAVIIVRMRWTNQINERSRIVFDGRTYQVLPETFHPYKPDNTLQFHAQLIINDNKIKSRNYGKEKTGGDCPL